MGTLVSISWDLSSKFSTVDNAKLHYSTFLVVIWTCSVPSDVWIVYRDLFTAAVIVYPSSAFALCGDIFNLSTISEAD